MSLRTLEDLLSSLGNVGLYFKLLFLLVTLPIWGPIVKVMWTEVNAVLAPEGGLYGRRRIREIPRPAPGLSPFVNVPLAGHRTARPVMARRAPAAVRPVSAGGAGARGGFRARRP